MRVTERGLSEAALRHMLASAERMARYQDQISSGKRIRRPEDDPVAVARALDYRASLAQVAQNLRSTDSATNWLNATDTALGSLAEVIQVAARLARQGASDSLSSEARGALSTQVQELLEEAVQLGNARHQGRYIFAGFKTDTAPFEAVALAGEPPSAVNFLGDRGGMELEIEPGVAMEVNLIGEDVFSGLFSTLIDLRDALRTGTSEDIAPLEEELETALTTALDARAGVGAKINRLRNSEARLREVETDLTAFLSREEDTDVAEAILRFSAEEYTYQAALAVNAQVLRTSLLDFLTG